MDVPVLTDQQELTYKSSVRKHDVVRKTSRERWMIVTDGEREREYGESVLAARLDDIYIYVANTSPTSRI